MSPDSFRHHDPRVRRLHHAEHPEGRLDLIAQQVTEWRGYISEQRPVLPGSSLAKDDEVFSVFPASHLTWHGISSAVDHLDMFMVSIRAGQSHPLAPQTLARTGMLSGAHALWVLDHGDRVTRQRRGLQLAYQEFAEDHKAVREIATFENPNPAAGLAEMQSYLDVRQEWMDRAVAVGATLGMTSGQVTTFGETDVLDKVTRHIVQDDPQKADMIRAVRVLWRTYSGIAHGYRWSAMFRTDIGEGEADQTGAVHGNATNDVGELATAAAGVSIFLLRAISLFERRRQPV